ncbi:hypothetical protein DOTSEDRAFT_21625 [Dothistroma septosporum NZE10]|uniref:Mid2 domain-containing protein n=1 Tax=Dothistroma septosporum (strain NZE10 / CBS 128990) TaxID=675120 RepID=N1PY22_DOTSN|nr:hypothetical protein DOTSEDRAFT_21625 [Dothistroma septosporum NZE10]
MSQTPSSNDMDRRAIALLFLLHATHTMAFESAAVNTYSATQVNTGPAPTGPKDREISHLSQGARAGIATSAIFGAIVVLAIAFFVWKRVKRARMEKASQGVYLELQSGGPNKAALSQPPSAKPAESVPDLHLPLAHMQRSEELGD